MTAADHQLSTVHRAFEIVELLWEEETLGVTELADRLGGHKSTIHGYLRTLEATGFVINDGGQYRLGLRFLEVGGRLKHRSRLFHVARPQLERLANDTGFTASLTVEEAGELVIVHLVAGDRSLQLGIYPGMRVPLHSHAAGKCILANADDDHLNRDELDAVTPYTKTDPEAVRAELDVIRECGYAVDWDEQVVGMGIVAAPIVVDNIVHGSVGLVCPTNQLTDENYRTELAQQVRKTTNVIGVNYRYGH